jgi:transcriptional regulator with XRE-family HTH domain
MAIFKSSEYRVSVPEDLGAALRYFRTQNNVSQREAAEWEGVSQPYLSNLESGKFGSSLNHALRLLRLLGYEVVVRRESKSG